MSATRTVIVLAGVLGCSGFLLAQNSTATRPYDQQHNFTAGTSASWSIESPSTAFVAPSVSSARPANDEALPMDAHVVERAEHENRVWATLGAKLNKPVTLKAQNATLRQAILEIAQQIQAPIRIDEQAMEEEGVTVDDETGPLALYNMHAHSAAKHLLRDYTFELVVDGDSLLVTTEARADEMLVTRVYAVGDLVTASQDEQRLIAYQELMTAIQQTTDGPWLDIDGTGGTLSPCLAGGSDAFVIRQSYKVHRDIEKLLYDLRKARGFYRR